MEIEAYTGWLIFGTVLMILEVVVPGVFLLWIGLAALLTGGIAFIFPALPFAATGSVFAVLSVIFAWLGHKIVTPAQEKAADTPLNNRLESYVGQNFQVQDSFVDGRGKIKIGDTVWGAVCSKNPVAGTTVKVVSINGTALEIEPVNE